MNKKYIFAALISAIFVFAGCSDDWGNESGRVIKQKGDEICFGGSASYGLNTKAGTTRTVYGGYGTKDENGEPVYWTADDKVRIHCAVDGTTQVSDYVVSSADGTKADASLDKVHPSGLQWGNTTSKHTFYAMYPSPEQYLPDGIAQEDILDGGTTVKGEIPSTQVYSKYEKNGTNHIFYPDMKYAYMVAKTVIENPSETKGDGDVFLQFKPIATAVEFSVINNSGSSLDIKEINIASVNNSISGQFAADLATLETTGSDTDDAEVLYSTNYPTGIKYVENTTGSVIKIPLYNAASEPTTVADGEKITFTVFMLPTTNYTADAVSDLKINIVATAGTKTGTLTGISVERSLKSYIHNLPLGQQSYTQTEWMKYLSDDENVNFLSIPGAGGAASGDLNEDGTCAIDDTYREQDLSIGQLWDQGIRCFEFTVDKDEPATDGTTDLGSVNVFCNGQDCGVTLADAVKAVKDRLTTYPKEFAMVIITYQQESGWDLRNETTGIVTKSRDSKTFMEQLNTFWKEVTAGSERLGTWPEGTGTALYNHNSTVGASRGKLFCIARPTSLGEDNFAQVNENTDASDELTSTSYPTSIDAPVIEEPNILVIHGWGALKDKWYARGYTDCVYLRGIGNTAFNAALTNLDDAPARFGYNTINSKRPGRPFDVAASGEDEFTTLPATGKGYAFSTDSLDLDANFYYSTIHANSDGLQTQKAWVQEWARVAEKTTTFEIEACSHYSIINTCKKDGVYIKWISSLKEKQNNVTDCLNFAFNKKITVNGEEEEANDVIFINSLCGYYIDISAKKESAYPNSLTDCNVASYEDVGDWLKTKYKFNKLTAASSEAGMSGNIESFAEAINNFFLGKLNEKTTNGKLPGSTGIVLMDRVTNVTTEAGAKIPSIIIANNFNFEMTTEVALSTLEEDDVVAAPKVRRTNEKPSITWGEWE